MKKVCVIVTVLAGIVLPTTSNTFETIQLQGSLGDVTQQAGYTRIEGAGDMFWWFYPTSQANRPVLVWLSGVTDLPPSLAANIGMFGPYDHNMNQREDSWVEDYNLLFIDAPLGTGFSTALNEDSIPKTVEENAEHLLLTLASFYSVHDELSETPLYIFGEGHGAQLALALAKRVHEGDDAESTEIYRNLQGLALGNGVVSPGVTLTKLGFYLEELGYIDANGRSVIETLASDTQSLISNGQLGQAFSNFVSLGDIVNERAGAVAVNLRHIVERVTREPTTSDFFGRMNHLQSSLRSDAHLFDFMNDVVGPALGISGQEYDAGRAAVIEAFRDSYMAPAISMVEYILQNTNKTVSIYNGNLDAVSNTPGQLEWVENLQWPGQEEFLSSTRAWLVLNQQMEGYLKESTYLRFYWVNAAGQSVPLDSPIAMRRVLRAIAGF